MTQPNRPQQTKAERKEAARANRVAQEQAAAASATRRKRLFQLGGVLGLAVVVVVVAILVSSGGGDDDTTASGELQGAQQVQTMLAGIPQDGLTLGQADAPVTMVEFIDPQCPFCKQFANKEFPALVQDDVRTGKLKVELRTLSFIGDDSVKGALTIQGAAEQDKAWNVAEILFHNQGAENSGWLTDDLRREALAAVPGLDVDAALQAADSDAAAQQLAAATSEARRYGADSTPSFALGRTGQALELSDAEPTAAALGKAIDALVPAGQGT